MRSSVAPSVGASHAAPSASGTSTGVSVSKTPSQLLSGAVRPVLDCPGTHRPVGVVAVAAQRDVAVGHVPARPDLLGVGPVPVAVAVPVIRRRLAAVFVEREIAVVVDAVAFVGPIRMHVGVGVVAVAVDVGRVDRIAGGQQIARPVPVAIGVQVVVDGRAVGWARVVRGARARIVRRTRRVVRGRLVGRVGRAAGRQDEEQRSHRVSLGMRKP